MSAPGRSPALIPEPGKGEGSTVCAPGRSQALMPKPFQGEGMPMTTLRLPHALPDTLPRAPRGAAPGARPGLAAHLERALTRLAAWADRQPQHHRLGRWTQA